MRRYDDLEDILGEVLPPAAPQMRTGVLRATFLFAGLIIGLSLLAAPAFDRGSRTIAERMAPGLDMLATGSIPQNRAYVVHRSVLQPPGAGPCILTPGMPGRVGC